MRSLGNEIIMGAINLPLDSTFALHYELHYFVSPTSMRWVLRQGVEARYLYSYLGVVKKDKWSMMLVRQPL